MSSFFNTRLVGSIWHVVTGGKSPAPSPHHTPDGSVGGAQMGPNTGGPHFVGAVPRPLRHGDVLIISGTVVPEPEQFSINLCCDHPSSTHSPKDIAYHSKTLFATDEVVTSYKEGGSWGEEDGPHVNPFLPGEPFVITIHLAQDEIVTYEGTSNYLHSCNHVHDVGDIKTVQVWHDVERVTELTFRFGS